MRASRGRARCLEEELAIARRLLEPDPGNTDQRDVAIALGRLAV